MKRFWNYWKNIYNIMKNILEGPKVYIVLVTVVAAAYAGFVGYNMLSDASAANDVTHASILGFVDLVAVILVPLGLWFGLESDKKWAYILVAIFSTYGAYSFFSEPNFSATNIVMGFYNVAALGFAIIVLWIWYKEEKAVKKKKIRNLTLGTSASNKQ